MQGKSLIRLILILFVLACLYYLSFTFITSRWNNKADSYAKNLVEQNPSTDYSINRTAFLDSIGNENIIDIGPIEYTYNDCKEKQLNLGLDLQGGMSTVLQVSLVDLIKYLSGESADPTFHQAIDDALQMQKNSDDDFVTLFGRAFQNLDPNARLAAIFSSQELKGAVDFNSTNDEVLQVISEKSNEAIESTFKIIRTRIDQFGVASPNVQLQEGSGRIIVELPGVDNPDRVRDLLQKSAKLEFWETYENSGAQGMAQFLISADQRLKDVLDARDPQRVQRLKEINNPLSSTTDNANTNDGTDTSSTSLLTDNIDNEELADTSANAVREESLLRNPLITLLNPAYVSQGGRQVPQQGATVAYALKKDTAQINKYLEMKELRSVFPQNSKLAWESKPTVGENIIRMFALKSRFNDSRPRMEGDVITTARDNTNATGQVVVTMDMNSTGRKEWAKMTGENVGKQVAVVLDNKVYSAPVVNGKITGGNTEISGNFTIREAKDLANILKAGSLPAPAKIIEEAVVGPSMGADNIRSSLLALLIGLMLVLVFMILWYNNAGIVANIALILNLFFIVGILAAMGGTLTLPGMAGVLLTVGMAVDANVLIFERIREELAKGSGIRKAISDGYSKSYSAIIDANVTTLITGIILAVFGLGPVLGFAVVLIIGILSSLFTAIFVSRLVIDWRLSKDKEPKFYSNFSQGAFKKLNIDFIGRRRFAYITAAVIIGLGTLSMVLKGFDYGVEFSGGRNYVVQFDKATDIGEIRNALKAQFGEQPIVKSFSTNNQYKITTDYLIGESGDNVDARVESELYAALKGFYTTDPGEAKFKNEYRLSSQKVGPTIADDIKKTSVWATLLALLAIFLYILVRFRKWQYGLGAIIALFVNVMIVLSFFSIFSGILPFTMEIDQAFIAAILMVIGYSINDTVVVFDRIREYLQTYTKQPMQQVINSAINSTLSRTIITSLTTLIVVLVLFIFGGETIRGFSFALLIGIIVGTLSSIFIATPIVTDLTSPERQRIVYNERAKRGKDKKKPATA